MKQSLKQTEKALYTAPTCEFLNVLYEGVLCDSNRGSINDWDDDGEEIDF